MAKQAGKLAHRYARALLNAIVRESGSAGDGSPAQKTAEELRGFAAIWQQQPELSRTLLNPMFEKNQRANALLEVAKKAGLSDLSVRFLRVIFERDRIAALPEIALAFSSQADSAAGVLQVEVTTARAVEGSEKGQIESSLRTQLKGRLEFTWKVDASILGGLVLRYAGKVVDGSLGGRLSRIEQKLQVGN